MTALRFASSESAGATCVDVDPNGESMAVGRDSVDFVHDAAVDQLCVPLPTWAYRAGARETIFFNPKDTRVAIVTCGGLCPGLNDVVQGLVNKAQDYGVPEGNILGIRYGFKASRSARRPFRCKASAAQARGPS
jgi:6-phosphofructokinase 1